MTKETRPASWSRRSQGPTSPDGRAFSDLSGRWVMAITNTSVWHKVSLNIDQVSQLTGVKKTTLRYWEKEFSEYLKPERTDTQRRQYSMEEVEKVSVLKKLIEEEKYKSAGVRLKLGLGSIGGPQIESAPAVPDPEPPGG